jgi:hypothetical protein
MWNMNVQGKKEDISKLIDEAPEENQRVYDKLVATGRTDLDKPEALDEHAQKQITAARALAQQLVSEIAGPSIVVSMAGHCNGVGEKQKAGMSNDFVTVTVSQKVP